MNKDTNALYYRCHELEELEILTVGMYFKLMEAKQLLVAVTKIWAKFGPSLGQVLSQILGQTLCLWAKFQKIRVQILFVNLPNVRLEQSKSL